MNFFRNTTRLCVGGALIGALALAGCGSSSKSSSSTGTTAAASATTSTVSSSTDTSGSSSSTVPVCESFQQFKSELQDLAKPATFTGGKDSIQNAVDQVKSDVDNLKSSLKSDDKPKLDAFQNALTDLQDAVGKMSGLSGITDAASAGKDVATTGGALLDALKAGCPSS